MSWAWSSTTGSDAVERVRSRNLSKIRILPSPICDADLLHREISASLRHDKEIRGASF
jgi:hypothetical protein